MTTDTKPAAGEKGQPAGSHTGTVTAVTGNKLTTTCGKGDTHDMTMAKDATITCDGKKAAAADVKVGSNVQVTAHADDKTVATAVACTSAPQPANAKKA